MVFSPSGLEKSIDTIRNTFRYTNSAEKISAEKSVCYMEILLIQVFQDLKNIPHARSRFCSIRLKCQETESISA